MIDRVRSPFAPLPGMEAPQRGIFIDRWGTLLDLAGHDAGAFDPELFSPGCVDALFRASQSRWNLYLIGNDDSVALGRRTREEWEAFDEGMHTSLASFGVRFLRDYTCQIDPADDGVVGATDSVYRLPNTGAFYHAAHNDDILLDKSWVVGDSTIELVAGWRAGVKTLGLGSGQALGDGEFHVDPDLEASDLADAIQGLLELAGSLMH